MTEKYRVNPPSTFSPNQANATRIDMRVKAIAPKTTEVFSMKAYKGSQQSYEREVTPRRADLYLSNTRFATLQNHVNAPGSTVHILYDAPSVPGDDPITIVDIIANY
jgi:hypothetical protein